MSTSHRTSAIPRPQQQLDRFGSGPDGTGGTADGDHTRFRDFTRPIALDRRLFVKRHQRLLIGALCIAVLCALGAALFILPAQAWLRQGEDLSRKQAQLDVLADVNVQLAAENARARTVEGGKEAAREELGFVELGEVRLSVLPGAAAPVTLPTGWPYDVIGKIVAAREAMIVGAETPVEASTEAPEPTVPTGT